MIPTRHPTFDSYAWQKEFPASRVVGRTWTRLCQVACGLRGHDLLRHFEAGRVTLRCVDCGAETPGWTIDVRAAFGPIAGPRARAARDHATPRPPRAFA
jgi:hypothetical protein